MPEIAVERLNLTEFFRELLRESMRAQDVASTEETEFYLVRMLEGLARTERTWLEKPFALDYMESFHAPHDQRVTKLRRVADTTLLMSGLFVESLQRTVVGADYYVRLGRSAYGQLARLTARHGRAVTNSFGELSERYTDFMRVLAEISIERLFPDDQRLLRTYSRWLRSPGARDAEWLVRRGMLPAVAPPKRGH